MDISNNSGASNESGSSVTSEIVWENAPAPGGFGDDCVADAQGVLGIVPAPEMAQMAHDLGAQIAQMHPDLFNVLVPPGGPNNAPPPPAATLHEQIAMLSSEERAELLAYMLGMAASERAARPNAARPDFSRNRWVLTAALGFAAIFFIARRRRNVRRPGL